MTWNCGCFGRQSATVEDGPYLERDGASISSLLSSRLEGTPIVTLGTLSKARVNVAAAVHHPNGQHESPEPIMTARLQSMEYPTISSEATPGACAHFVTDT